MGDDPGDETSGQSSETGRQEGVEDDDRRSTLDRKIWVEFSVNKLEKQRIQVFLLFFHKEPTPLGKLILT
jgi:hypothetical protein